MKTNSLLQRRILELERDLAMERAAKEVAIRQVEYERCLSAREPGMSADGYTGTLKRAAAAPEDDEAGAKKAAVLPAALPRTEAVPVVGPAVGVVEALQMGVLAQQLAQPLPEAMLQVAQPEPQPTLQVKQPSPSPELPPPLLAVDVPEKCGGCANPKISHNVWHAISVAPIVATFFLNRGKRMRRTMRSASPSFCPLYASVAQSSQLP
ncbi:uncharacterized protein LOC117134832 [Drosophila busckii]|uniref:uncharacterized protein LOC117134832 n=1 Tax=Drosophila busckii TaxID=30019 RepID=UPI001432ABF9|nr:uncharacterized protein LOC117134832 [Drosophila busckii]